MKMRPPEDNAHRQYRQVYIFRSNILFAVLRFNLLVPFRANPLTMSPSTYYLIICCLLPPYAVSLALNTAPNPDASLTLAQPSILDLNATTLTEGKIDCDQGRFGNPPSASCRDAMALLPRDARSLFRRIKRSYGPRTQGTWDVNLPSRLISCKSIIEIYLIFIAFDHFIMSADVYHS